MPPAPLAGNAVTGAPDPAAAPGIHAPAPVTPGHRPRKPPALLPRRAQAALPAAASNSTGTASADNRGNRRWRLAGLPRPAPKAGASHHDPLFERPDLVEDDYYRFRHQPRGW